MNEYPVANARNRNSENITVTTNGNVQYELWRST